MVYTKSRELERKHLVDAISEILHKPLGIITAPSGYGKTTIAKSFFHYYPEITGLWLSLGNASVDEVWVWRKLCNTFRDQNPRLCQILTELGLPETLQETDYFISVIREYVQKPVCLVLDDYHECNGHILNKLIERIVYEEIPNFHLLIISRTSPDIACEELLIKGYCVLLDQHMLSLSKKESEQAFKLNNIELTAEEADKIFQYTDGWIAAVYLALYNYKRIGHFEHLTNVNRLLKTAIFDKLSDSMQELCIKMSIFESFTLEEACYIMDKDISLFALEHMQYEFGFIQFDSASGSFIMHSLLRSVSAGELERLNIEKRYLFRRCGEYHEKISDYIGAIVSYKNAGDHEKILDILSGKMRDVIFEQAPGIIDDFFQSIPLELRMCYPVAYLGYIYYIIMKENAVRGQQLFLEVSDKYKELTSQNDDYQYIMGELLIIETFFYFNNLKQINLKLEEAYKLLGYHTSRIFGDALLTFGTPSVSILYYKQSGELKETIEQEKKFAKFYTRILKGVDSGWDDLFDAEYALMQNDLVTADKLSCKVIERAAFTDEVCISISSYYIRLRCFIQQGKEKEFYNLMDAFEKQMEHTVRPILVTDYELACGYLFACIGRIEKIPDWLCKFNLENCSRIVRNVRNVCVVYGVMLCHMKKWELLDAVAEQMLVPYENTCHTYIIIFGYILKAISVLNITGSEKACEYFMKAVKLAEPDNLKIPFIEMAAHILPIIEELGTQSDFCASLKLPAKQYQQSLKAFQKKDSNILLTKREEELMSFVKQGLRNSDISQKMNIALVTVEKNLTNIYRKLNVSNRAAAIARLEKLS